MKNIFLLFALLAGCASNVRQSRVLASAGSSDAHDPKYAPYHFGNLTERFHDQMNAVGEQQKVADAALAEAGSRCIDGWAEFAKDAPELEARLVAEALAANAVVQKMEDKLTWHYASATPAYNDVMCGPEVVSYLKANKAVLNQLVTDLEIEEQNFERLQLEGIRRFSYEAGASFARKPSCPVKYRYDEAVTGAFSAISNRSDLPISGFAGARLALKQYKLITVGEISEIDAMLDYQNTGCRK